MGIRVTIPNAMYPQGAKLANRLTSYLFEQKYMECSRMSAGEIESIRKVIRILSKSK